MQLRPCARNAGRRRCAMSAQLAELRLDRVRLFRQRPDIGIDDQHRARQHHRLTIDAPPTGSSPVTFTNGSRAISWSSAALIDCFMLILRGMAGLPGISS
jgi:hypothetical protein